MYIVTRNTKLPKIFRNNWFESYNQARSAVRKWIRNTKEYKMQRDLQKTYYSDTPDLASFGFQIKQTKAE